MSAPKIGEGRRIMKTVVKHWGLAGCCSVGLEIGNGYPPPHGHTVVAPRELVNCRACINGMRALGVFT